MAMASPMALPTPSMIAAKIPDLAAGRITRKMVCICVAPKAREDAFKLGCTARIASEKSFYDALEVSSQPIVCSHSSSRALCDHPRNLTDDQLRQLAARGGVAQVTLYSGFLRQNAPATIEDAISHLNHMVNIMGVDHVGIGTDFDGDGGIIGCASASELINFTRCLLRERYSEEEIRLIWGGNFLRVMQQVQDARTLN